MLQEFIREHREHLLDRCRQLREARMVNGTDRRTDEGLSRFFDQLVETIDEEKRQQGQTDALSGSYSGIPSQYEIGKYAAFIGKTAQDLGFNVDDVIHSYGDVCRSITELALQKSQHIPVAEYRQLNRCLDNAIASAVAEFTFRRDVHQARLHGQEENKRLAALGSELRNQLGTATLAVAALRSRELTVEGTTGAILARSLHSLGRMIDDMLDYAEIKAAVPGLLDLISLTQFMDSFERTIEPAAQITGRQLRVTEIDPTLAVMGKPETLQAALAGLLQTAFQQAKPGDTVEIHVYAHGADVRIDIACPNRPVSLAEQEPALAVPSQLLAGMHGRLAIRDEPDSLYTLTLVLPRYALPS